MVERWPQKGEPAGPVRPLQSPRSAAIYSFRANFFLFFSIGSSEVESRGAVRGRPKDLENRRSGPPKIPARRRPGANASAPKCPTILLASTVVAVPLPSAGIRLGPCERKSHAPWPTHPARPPARSRSSADSGWPRTCPVGRKKESRARSPAAARLWPRARASGTARRRGAARPPRSAHERPFRFAMRPPTPHPRGPAPPSAPVDEPSPGGAGRGTRPSIRRFPIGTAGPPPSAASSRPIGPRAAGVRRPGRPLDVRVLRSAAAGVAERPFMGGGQPRTPLGPSRGHGRARRRLEPMALSFHPAVQREGRSRVGCRQALRVAGRGVAPLRPAPRRTPPLRFGLRA